MIKETKQKCFKTKKDLEQWQKHNCDLCKKCVRLNKKNGYMPAYKCAIQRDIEKQINGAKTISERAFDMTRSDACPMLRPKADSSPKKKEAEIDVSNEVQSPKTDGEQVLQRHLSLPIEKRISDATDVFEKHVAEAYDVLINGYVGRQNEAGFEDSFLAALHSDCAKFCNNPCTNDIERKMRQFCSELAQTKDMKEVESVFRRYLKFRKDLRPEKIYEETKKYLDEEIEIRTAKLIKNHNDNLEKQLQSVLTDVEKKNIFYLPGVLVDFAFSYVDEALKLAARNKIAILRDLSREVRKQREWWENNKREKYTYRQQNAIKDIVKHIKDNAVSGKDLRILYITVNNRCFKEDPDYPYQEQRTNAVIAIMFIDFLHEFGEKNIKMMGERAKMNMTAYEHADEIEALRAAMIAYAGDKDFNFSDYQVQLAFKIVKKHFNLDFKDFDIPY